MAIERQRYPNAPKLQGLGEEEINVIVEDEELEPTTDFQNKCDHLSPRCQATCRTLHYVWT